MAPRPFCRLPPIVMLVSDRGARAKALPPFARLEEAMAHRILVLGAKPDPALPPPGSYDAVACANASGRSAAATAACPGRRSPC